MGILSGMFIGGYDVNSGTTELINWCQNFLHDHPMHSNVVLTKTEKDSWFEAMEEFRTYYRNNPRSGTFYTAPIDTTMLPVSLLNLWNLSNCDYNKY